MAYSKSQDTEIQTDSLPFEDALEAALAHAQQLGAHDVEGIVYEGWAISCRMRNGKREEVTAEEGRSLRLRVLAEVGKEKQTQLAEASGETSDLSISSIKELVSRAYEMAKLAPPDIALGLAEPQKLATNPADLDCNDPITPTANDLLQQCLEMEAAAREIKEISATEAVAASFTRSHIHHHATNGLKYSNTATLSNLSAAMVAGSSTTMEVDWDSSHARHASDLDTPTAVGKRAAERAKNRLHPRAPQSGTVDVIFEPRVANSFLSALANAANGEALTRGTSFLLGREDIPILPTHLSLIDQPQRKRGLASRAVDAEGLPTQQLNLFANGLFQAPLLDLATARRLQKQPSANAVSRGAPSPGTSNLYLKGGNIPLQSLLNSIKNGVWITDLLGFGFNPVTGDWSRAAAGFHIANGQRNEPISGFTLAGNLPNFLPNLQAADNLKFLTPTNSPSLLIHGLTLAGT